MKLVAMIAAAAGLLFAGACSEPYAPDGLQCQSGKPRPYHRDSGPLRLQSGCVIR